jgi:hypothetical protein
MRNIYGVAASIVALSCAVTASIPSTRVMAQGVPTPEMQVPAIREPHHFVKLDNKYARVLDVTVAPFSGTLYHIHENPYFWISIGAATLRGQTLGAKEIINIEPADGEVRYSPVITHRVGNIGSTAFRNITVQIQARDDVSPSGDVLASPKPAGYQAKPALDNELVRVERLILEPGQSTGRYMLPRSGLMIAARDATISVERPGSSAHRVEMKAGDFEWHTGPVAHTITNIGKTRFEAIEAVWK